MKKLFTRIYRYTLTGIGIAACYGVIIAAIIIWAIRFTHAELLIRALSIITAICMLFREGDKLIKFRWALLVLLLPHVGLPVYLFYGGGRPSYLLRKKIKKTKLETDKSYIQAYNTSDETAKYLTSVFCPAVGYTAKYYRSGEYMFPELISELKKAEKYIFFEFFIIENSDIWDEILEVFRERAEKGVEVKIIYDDFGSMGCTPPHFPRQIEALHKNIKCLKFNPVIPIAGNPINMRDHRKIVVIDGRVSFTGGVNIADRYLNTVRPYGYWKDSGFMLCGNAVSTELALIFAKLWNSFRNDKIDTKALTANIPSDDIADDGGTIIPYLDIPDEPTHITKDILISIFSNAEKTLNIFAPYPLFDKELTNAIIDAKKRGVYIRMIVPAVADKKAVYRLSCRHCRGLLRQGIEIYRYTPGFVHTKAITADGTVALIGSANTDPRSIHLSIECGGYLMGGGVIDEINKDFQRTIDEDCVRLEQKHIKTNILGKLIDLILMIFEPLF